MNGRCYKCNNRLTTGDFDWMCNNCRKQQNDTEISIVEQALNELERFKKFKETFDNYILQLNARIKINKEIIEENFDLDTSLCHDLEVENTALEFALMLLEGERK